MEPPVVADLFLYQKIVKIREVVRSDCNFNPLPKEGHLTYNELAIHFCSWDFDKTALVWGLLISELPCGWALLPLAQRKIRKKKFPDGR
jgi:hypothetical protein